MGLHQLMAADATITLVICVLLTCFVNQRSVSQSVSYTQTLGTKQEHKNL